MWKSFLQLFLEAKFVARFRCLLRLHLCGAPVKTAVFLCLYTYTRFITAERILMKFDIGLLYENLSSHFTFRLDWTVLKPTKQETDRNFCTQFATNVSQLKIWHFWVIGIERNVCRCTFSSYGVITLESNCVVVALIENYSTSKPLKVFFWKITILSCDTCGILATCPFTSLFCACAFTCPVCTRAHITTFPKWSVVDCNAFSRICAFHTTSYCSHVVRIRGNHC
jgi:hypothetical protein